MLNYALSWSNILFACLVPHGMLGRQIKKAHSQKKSSSPPASAPFLLKGLIMINLRIFRLEIPCHHFNFSPHPHKFEIQSPSHLGTKFKKSNVESNLNVFINTDDVLGRKCN